MKLGKCSECEGTGYIESHCTSCNGSGEGMYDGSCCSTCRGSGSGYAECSTCEGIGETMPEYHLISNVDDVTEYYEVVTDDVRTWMINHIDMSKDWEVDLIEECAL